MSAGRTVTVQTRDHGTVTIPEPEWCTGEGHPDGSYLGDISHYGPDVMVTVGSWDGPRELLTLALAQHRESDRPPGTAVHVTVHLADDQHSPYDEAALDQLADDMVDAAREVRHMARHLGAVSRAGGGR